MFLNDLKPTDSLDLSLKLPPIVKALWLARLRDPHVKQGRYKLAIPAWGGYTYCCLGVLGEACGLRNMDLSAYARLTDCILDIPADVRDAVEAALSQPVLLSTFGDVEFTVETLLMTLNDDLEWSFLDIATLIAGNL